MLNQGINIVFYIITSLMTGLVTYVWWDLKAMKERIESTLPKEDIRSLVDDKLVSVNKQLDSLDNRLNRIEDKIDQLIINSKNG